MLAEVTKIVRSGTANTRVILNIGLELMLPKHEFPVVDIGTKVMVPDNIAPIRTFTTPLIRPANPQELATL